MYSYLWKLDGYERLRAIYDLPLFATDDIHIAARRNCLRCPLAIRFLGSDGRYHTCCVDVTNSKRIDALLASGGKFIKREDFKWNF